jgi:hypothetical protein
MQPKKPSKEGPPQPTRAPKAIWFYSSNDSLGFITETDFRQNDRIEEN